MAAGKFHGEVVELWRIVVEFHADAAFTICGVDFLDSVGDVEVLEECNGYYGAIVGGGVDFGVLEGGTHTWAQVVADVGDLALQAMQLEGEDL